jgi:hypothetical protein
MNQTVSKIKEDIQYNNKKFTKTTYSIINFEEIECVYRSHSAEVDLFNVVIRFKSGREIAYRFSEEEDSLSFLEDLYFSNDYYTSNVGDEEDEDDDEEEEKKDAS